MSFSDIFNASKLKKENDELTEKLRKLEAQITPDMRNAASIAERIETLSNAERTLSERIKRLNEEKERTEHNIEIKKNQLFDVEDRIIFQEYGLYKPKYAFANSEEYRQQLEKVRAEQKEMIKKTIAVTGNMAWTVNGSAAEGQRMVKDMQKLLLRAFNSECDECINKVTYANYDMTLKRINASHTAITKLGKIMSVAITGVYLRSKIKELDLAFEYQQMKQKEKEEQKELRAQMREEEKLQKEIEEARKKIEKEQNHYQQALQKVDIQLANASDNEKTDLLDKKKELESRLVEIDKNMRDIDYREANIKAGYVYIISNIGAFGENVYKIGMTRRLDPTERVDELGDASVPFNFDIHAMIFSDNAPALEAALHKAFEDRKLNMVNQRREFFNVTLDEIKDVVKKNFDKSVEYVDLPQAEQYRNSLRMKSETAQEA